jgi:hypothetical protein
MERSQSRKYALTVTGEVGWVRQLAACSLRSDGWHLTAGYQRELAGNVTDRATAVQRLTPRFREQQRNNNNERLRPRASMG